MKEKAWNDLPRNEHVTSSIVISLFSSVLFKSTCNCCNEKKVNYLVALEDETGVVSGGSSFTLGLADWRVVLMENGYSVMYY